MSKKQPDSNFGETLASLLILAARHPKETTAAVNIINALEAVTYDLTTAALDYLFPRKAIASKPEHQPLTSYVDEQQEAFTPPPLWPLAEEQPVGFVNGFFPVYDRRPRIFRL
jgi:hypothetical protein